MYIFTTDDRKEFEYAFHGLDFLLALWDMDQWLRGEIKYSQLWSETEKNVLETARSQLFEILDSYGVDLDMLE